MEPLLPHLAGIDHLVLDRPMNPCELLITADGRSLGERFDISYVPSAMVLQLLAELPARSGFDRALALSGPSEPGGGATMLSLLDAEESERSHRLLRSAYKRQNTPLRALPRLRYAALEAEAVASRFPASTLLVNQGSVEQSLETLAGRGELRRYDIVHLAGHTLTDAAPERCAVALSADDGLNPGRDGLLEVEDILLSWELDAGLLTLSGCETLRPAGAARQDPLGFLPALFGSGARRVLSSLWTVDDRSTAILMDRFYEDLTGRYRGERAGYREARMPPARALREAKHYVRTLTDARGRRPFEHPAYWAGFVLVGLP
jgi:CHAT domain-containing protein